MAGSLKSNFPKHLCGGIDMNTSTARQIVLAARPNGKPKLTDFHLEETAVPTPSSGQILLGVQYLSLDPYMRGRMDDCQQSCETPPLIIT
jgi:NADPH-dependent curcumin reductase CurA